MTYISMCPLWLFNIKVHKTTPVTCRYDIWDTLHQVAADEVGDSQNLSSILAGTHQSKLAAKIEFIKKQL